MFLHEEKDFRQLIERIADERNILPQLIEKDYWIMHCLWGLKQQNYSFELKGGTSLSKAFGIIERFSEDIDIKINPPKDEKVFTKKNHEKSKHIESRKIFFDRLGKEIRIPFIEVSRDTAFDDSKFRSAGILLAYQSVFDRINDIKTGVLLEAGFAKTTPNVKKIISSWAYDFAIQNSDKEKWTDNRAVDIKCFEPGYTLIEKIEAVCRKHSQYLNTGKIEANFLRHYYDIYCLIADADVKRFIGSNDYIEYKNDFVGRKYNTDISTNEALMLNDNKTFSDFEKAYLEKKALYYGGFISFQKIIQAIRSQARTL